MENDSQAVTRVPSIEEQPRSIPQFTQLPPTKDIDLLEPSRTVTPSVRSFDAAPPRRSGWDLRPFHGMITDVRRRLPYYWSDWKDAWTYRVIPATAMIFFAKYVQHSPVCLLTSGFIDLFAVAFFPESHSP